MATERVSIAEYAAQRGVSRQAIYKLIQDGKIPARDGKIDPEEADRAYEQNVNPAARYAGQQGKTAARDDEAANYAKARAAEKMLDLQIKKKQLERFEEKYIERAVVEGTVFALARATRDAWRVWPARRTIGNLVYAVLTSNPTMSDGVALFHANHNNLLSAAAISTASVDAMRVAMATQKDPDGHAAGGLNIRLGFLLVPMGKEGTAKVVRDSEFEVDPTATDKRIPNSVRGTFDVVSDARLDADSATAWYGAARATVNDTVEVAYLDGRQEPVLEQQGGWTIDGTEFKVRIDAGVKALDFRGLAKNPGA